VAWTFIVIAGLLETVWAVAMKVSHGPFDLIPTAIMLAAMAGSFWFLSSAMRLLPLSTVYVTWTGIGAVGSFVVGVLALGERLNVAGALGAALIVAGVLLMRHASVGAA